MTREWYLLRRLRERLRSSEPKCLVARCPYPQIPTWSKWCRDHTDAIAAGGTLDKDGSIAFRLGARRWFLLAEILVERERPHVAVLDAILAQSDEERVHTRVCWAEFSPTDLRPSMAERADELLALSPPRRSRPTLAETS